VVAAGCVEVIDNPTVPTQTLGEACADPGGNFTTTGDIPPGRWYLRGYDPTGLHAAAVVGPLDIAAGQHIRELGVNLPKAAVLSGRTVDATTGAPVAFACPAAVAFLGHSQTPVAHEFVDCSDADGNWSVSGLPAGRFTLLINPDGSHVMTWAPHGLTQDEAELYTTRAGSTTSVGTIREHHGATLTGRITDRTGAPVPDAGVLVTPDTDFRFGVFGEYMTLTDADGRYTLPNIAPQRHSVLVEPPDGSGLAWQWSGNASDPEHATKIRFTYEGKSTFNAVLGPEAPLVVTAAPTTTGSFMVDVQTVSGAFVGFHTGANALFGPTTVHGLPPGKVAIRLTNPTTSTVSWYDRATSFDDATLVKLTTDTVTHVTVQ